jgi:hypothetical protein
MRGAASAFAITSATHLTPSKKKSFNFQIISFHT